jgi:Xaa-Pro dipeptidase
MASGSLSRREVLGAFALGAGALACGTTGPRPAVAAPSSRRRGTLPASQFAARTEYPPLPPLSDEVYARRRARARELAHAAGATVVLATSGATSFAYLVGTDYGRSERLIAFVLPVDGAPVLLAPSFEVERVRRGARGPVELQRWEEAEDPIAKLPGLFGAAKRTAILVEPTTTFAVTSTIARALPDATLIDGSHVFEELRVAKSDEEIDRMRRAVAITEDVFVAVFDRLEIDMLEKDVAQMIAEEHGKRGVSGGALVQFGPSAALPHGGPGASRLVDGMVVLIDGGCTVQGWASDITRTRWFGSAPPPERFRTVYNLVHDAQTAAIDRVRPGVPAEEIDRAARAAITAGGFGANFTHRLGHGIGIDGHEATYMVEGNRRPLAPGFVFSVEPGIYLPGEFGVRLEDDVVCGASGADVLSRRAPRL